MFKEAVSANLSWLVWAYEVRGDDLRALMPYVGMLEQVPAKWSVSQYVKALNDADCFA